MDRMNDPASAVSDRRGHPEPPARPASFEAFFEAEHGRLLRALYLVTGNAQEAEELMQDAFVAVWERWDRVSGMDEPTGYLYRTAMNRFRSRLRRASRAALRVIGSDEGSDAFAAADERDALARALARLPERQRSAIVLTELLGYGSEEAGRIRRQGRHRALARVPGATARAAGSSRPSTCATGCRSRGATT